MLGIVDETFRDGPQSLWATRMSTRAMLGATETTNRSGYRKVCITSGAAFETAVKFLHDDPWQRLRLLRTYMPDATIDILMRSRNLFGWERYPDDVVELMFRCLRDTGAQWVKVFDGLNDMRNIKAHFGIAKSLGLKSSGMIAFSLSPVHTDEYYAAKARELASYGVDSVTMADASGILTGERAASLFAALKKALKGKVPLEFVAHHSMGLAHASYREAIRAGVDTLATASTPLANGESIPSALDVVAMAEELGVETGLDTEAIRRTDDYFYWVAHKEGREVFDPIPHDAQRYARFAGHQIPGGMISNFRNQLRELGIYDRLEDVLEEAGRVRMELGYPIMVTPFSQFVGVQATLNVIQGERYKTVPKELRLYVAGQYGESAAPVDPNVIDKVLDGAEPDTEDPRAMFDRPMLGDYRKEHGPFRSDEELLLHLFYGSDHLETLKRNCQPIHERPHIDPPLPALVKELIDRPGLTSVSISRPDFRMDMAFAD